MQLRVYTSTSSRQLGALAANFGNFQLGDPFMKKVGLLYYSMGIIYQINLTLPDVTLRNGSLHAHCFLLPYEFDGENPYSVSFFGSLSL